MEKLLELLKSKETSYDIMGRYVDFTPSKSEVTFVKSDTGVEKTQLFQTEENFGWQVYIASSAKIYLIADKVTSYKISLNGMEGYHNIGKILKNHNEALYSQYDLNIEGEAMTLEFFKTLPDNFKNISEPYLLVGTNDINGIKGIWFANRDIPEFKPLYHRSGNTSFLFECAIRPMVKLPLNTMIDIRDAHRRGKDQKSAMKISIA